MDYPKCSSRFLISCTINCQTCKATTAALLCSWSLRCIRLYRANCFYPEASPDYLYDLLLSAKRALGVDVTCKCRIQMKNHKQKHRKGCHLCLVQKRLQSKAQLLFHWLFSLSHCHTQAIRDD